MAAIFVVALVVANLLVTCLGPVSAPFIAFGLIGLELTLRDRLHDRYGAGLSLALVVLAGAVSWMLVPGSGRIAAASFVAFVAAGWTDTGAYAALHRHSRAMRVNGSNVASAAVDSLIFPTIAFGGFMPEIVALQFAAKVGGGWIWFLLLSRKVHA
jgi:hypothetical protein